jgi:hypothetical protein
MKCGKQIEIYLLAHRSGREIARYQSLVYADRVAELGMEPSVGSCGGCLLTA